MQTLSKLLFLLFALLYQQVGFAQKGVLQGIATYKTAAMINLGGDSTMSPTQQEMIQQQVRKAMQREYTLSFKNHESNYKQVESLDRQEAAQAGGVMVRVANSSSLTYKNTKKKRYLEGADLFGKPFLIDDELESRDWAMTGKTKQIGKYECQQATYMTESRMLEVDSESGEPKEIIRQVEVSAWFTMDIPVNHGPDDFWGLPGLILEVNSGNFTIICTKVVLNPQEAVEIKVPKGGKPISRAEFAKLREEKMKEMQQQYNGNGPQRRMIRVGG
ncbi:MAG: GLPGLI family protein [Reichenbachiella sp.]|uniref:GLPGLI family protein n=1 Tax=Reichenbachiella sp. TaxID=2184521 RepID=UPI003264415A